MVLIHPKIKRFHCLAALTSISFFLVSFIMTFVPSKTFHRKRLKPIDSFTIPLHIPNGRHKTFHWKRLKPINSFTIPLHIPNGRHQPAGRNVQRDYLWGLQTRGYSHRLCEPTMHLESTQCYLYLSHSIAKDDASQ